MFANHFEVVASQTQNRLVHFFCPGERILPIFRVAVCFFLIFAVAFVSGCSKKTPPVLTVYCSASHLPAAEELGERFEKVYGVGVVCIPFDVIAPLKSDTEPTQFEKLLKDIAEQENETEKQLKKRKRKTDPIIWEKQEILLDEESQRLKKWVDNARFKDFVQFLFDNRNGDVFLCDSPEDAQRTKDDGFALEQWTIASISPVLLVKKGNPDQIGEVQDVLRTSKTLGIVHKEVAGIGKTTQKILEINHRRDTTLVNTESLENFESELLLLQAFEQGKVDAAICWQSTAERMKETAEIVPIPRSDFAATPFVFQMLSTGFDYNKTVAFHKFVNSEKGQSILEKHGYTVR